MKRILLLTVLTLLCSFLYADTDQIFKQILVECQQTTSNDRVACISAKFLGKPYLGEALGEGPHGHFNQKPLYTDENFDCETYVETVLALAHAKDLENFKKNIIKIRYRDGRIAFSHRNHFTDLEWVPNNAREGFILDATARIFASEKPPIVKTWVNRQAWYTNLPIERIYMPQLSLQKRKKRLEELHCLSHQVENAQAQLHYLPLKTILKKPELLQRIPNGSVILIIRHIPKLAEKIGTELSVIHMGLAIKDQNQLLFRHASSDLKKITELPLLDYLKPYEKNDNFKGIAVLTLGW